VIEFNDYDSNARRLDLASALYSINSAPDESVFILQGCCHNPTGADPTKEDWTTLAKAIKKLGHLTFLEFAY
jgi:aspartate aminotransferase